MTLNQFLSTLGVSITDLVRLGITGFIILMIGCIKIPKIELNIWSWLFQKIGKAINGEVINQVGAVKKDVDSLRSNIEKNEKIIEEEKIRSARQRILRFSDEVLLNQRHSKEHFEEVLEDIDIYEKYCQSHPKYENSKAVFAIDTIKKVYATCLEEKDFLGYEPLPNKRKKEDDNK